MRGELYIRVKQALAWLKRNQGILQKDVADKMGMAEASFTRALSRIKEKNDEDFVVSFHSAVGEFVSKMLGHTNITQTQRYAKVLAQSVHEDFDMIAEKMAQQQTKQKKRK